MRSYADACGITRALDVVGERWAIPVVRELVFGPRRYTDLAAALPGVSTNILGDRLKELTEAGVTVRRRLPAPAASTVYELTPWGAALEPVLVALGRWAAHTPADLSAQTLSASSLALSLKTIFDSDAAAGADLDLVLAMGEDIFEARVHGGSFTIRRLEPAVAEADERSPGSQIRVDSDPKTLAAVIFQDLEPGQASRTGRLRVDAPSDALDTFARCFPLPDPPDERNPR